MNNKTFGPTTADWLDGHHWEGHNQVFVEIWIYNLYPGGVTSIVK